MALHSRQLPSGQRRIAPIERSLENQKLVRGIRR
jgi:hypothetical protein